VYIYIEDNLNCTSENKTILAFVCWSWYSLVLKRHCDCTLL